MHLRVARTCSRHRPRRTPKTRDNVVIINAGKVRFTGNKLADKVYIRHTGYPGGQRFSSPKQVLGSHPERVLEHAIRGMLPKNRLSRQVIKKLKIYAGPAHPHVAQQPQPFPAFV